MATIKWFVEMGLNGCHREGEFEAPDDWTDAQIEECAKNEAFDFIDWGWTKED